jgi:hypothetical protein
MSKQTDTGAVPAAPISLEDLRHKALAIREDVTDEAKMLADERGTQIVIGAVVAVIAVISLAYHFGSRAGRRAVESRYDV